MDEDSDKKDVVPIITDDCINVHNLLSQFANEHATGVGKCEEESRSTSIDDSEDIKYVPEKSADCTGMDSEAGTSKAMFFCALCRMHISTTVPQVVIPPQPAFRARARQQLLKKYNYTLVEEMLKGVGTIHFCRKHVEDEKKEKEEPTTFFCALCLLRFPGVVDNFVVHPNTPHKETVRQLLYRRNSVCKVNKRLNSSEPLSLCMHHILVDKYQTTDGNDQTSCCFCGNEEILEKYTTKIPTDKVNQDRLRSQISRESIPPTTLEDIFAVARLRNTKFGHLPLRLCNDHITGMQTFLGQGKSPEFPRLCGHEKEIMRKCVKELEDHTVRNVTVQQEIARSSQLLSELREMTKESKARFAARAESAMEALPNSENNSVLETRIQPQRRAIKKQKLLDTEEHGEMHTPSGAINKKQKLLDTEEHSEMQPPTGATKKKQKLLDTEDHTDMQPPSGATKKRRKHLSTEEMRKYRRRIEQWCAGRRKFEEIKQAGGGTLLEKARRYNKIVERNDGDAEYCEQTDKSLSDKRKVYREAALRNPITEQGPIPDGFAMTEGEAAAQFYQRHPITEIKRAPVLGCPVSELPTLSREEHKRRRQREWYAKKKLEREAIPDVFAMDEAEREATAQLPRHPITGEALALGCPVSELPTLSRKDQRRKQQREWYANRKKKREASACAERDRIRKVEMEEEDGQYVKVEDEGAEE